jgi:hypothetical protein
MDLAFKRRFTVLWHRYFPEAELPIGYYYTDETPVRQPAPSERHQCVICELARVRRGHDLAFDVDTVRCGGGKRYLGFVQEMRPNFAYFLSCGIEGEMEGERYKKSPELVREYLQQQPAFEAPGRFIVFKRWDRMEATDEPLALAFFAPPDVLSGLFTLANYDEVEEAVRAPFAAGCASIVYHAYHELQSQRPRAILGMFDVSARPCIPSDVLTLTIPWPKFVSMVEHVEESFLITRSWERVSARIGKDSGPKAAG